MRIEIEALNNLEEATDGNEGIWFNKI
jgi:hypothetical protein